MKMNLSNDNTLGQTQSQTPRKRVPAQAGKARAPIKPWTTNVGKPSDKDTLQWYQGGHYGYGPPPRLHIASGKPHFQDPAQNIDIPAHSGSMAEIAAIPGRVKVISLDATTGSGALIFNELVGFAPTSDDIYANCDVLAAAFQQARGDFVYTIQPVATPYHQLTLYACFIPDTASPPDLTEALALDGITYMIHSSTVQEVPIPYQADVPWLFNKKVGQIAEHKQAYGRLLIYVLNPLSFRSNNVAPSIDINIHKCVHHFEAKILIPQNPFRWYYNTLNNNTLSIRDIRDKPSYMVERLPIVSESDNNVDPSTVTENVHSTDSDISYQLDSTLGPCVDNIYDLIQRPQLPHGQPEPPGSVVFPNTNTFMDHFANFFFAYSGSNVHTFMGVNDTGAYTVVGNPGYLHPEYTDSGTWCWPALTVKDIGGPVSVVYPRETVYPVTIRRSFNHRLAFPPVLIEGQLELHRVSAAPDFRFYFLAPLFPPSATTLRSTPQKLDIISEMADGDRDPVHQDEGIIITKEDTKSHKALRKVTRNVPITAPPVTETPYYADSFLWSEEHAPGYRIISIPLNRIVNNDAYPVHGFAAYQKLRRYAVKVVIKIPFTSFNAGGLYAIYNPTTTELSACINTFANGIGRHIDAAGDSTTFEFLVPFFSETYSDPTGFVDIYVYNALTGTSSIEGVVFFSLVNTEFAVRQVYPFAQRKRLPVIPESKTPQESLRRRPITRPPNAKDETDFRIPRIKFSCTTTAEVDPEPKSVTSESDNGLHPTDAAHGRSIFIPQPFTPPLIPDFVTLVKEWLDKYPEYKVTHEFVHQGPAHNRLYRCHASLKGNGPERLKTRGVERTMAKAKQAAFADLWYTIQRDFPSGCESSFVGSTTLSGSHITANIALHILTSGDVESNPGPVSPTNDEEASVLGQMFKCLTKCIKFLGTSATAILEFITDTSAQFFTAIQSKLVDWGFDLLTKAAIVKFAHHWETLFGIIKTFIIFAFIARKAYALLTGTPFTDVLLDLIVLTFVPGTMDVVKNFVSRFATAGFQSEGIEEHLPTIISLVTSLIAAVFGYSISAKNSLGAMLSLTLARMAASDAYKLLKEAFTKAIEWLCGTNPGADSAIAELEDLSVRIQETQFKFYRMRAEGKLATMNYGETTEESIETLAFMTQARLLVTRLRELITITGSGKELWTFIKDFEATWSSILKSQLASTARMEPVGICLRGGSGLGKSTLATSLIPELVLLKLGLVQDRKHAASQIYSMPTDPNQKFYDGYLGQLFCLYDDFGSAADGSDYTQFMQFISTASAQLNMANLDEKGTMFCSPFVTVTTNQACFKSNAIQNVSAMARRFPIDYHIGVNQEYLKNHQLNYTKLTLDLKTCSTISEEIALYDDIFVFYKVGPTGALPNSNRKFSEIIDEIVTVYRNKCAALIENRTSRFSLTNDLDPAKRVPINHNKTTSTAAKALKDKYGELPAEDFRSTKSHSTEAGGTFCPDCGLLLDLCVCATPSLDEQDPEEPNQEEFHDAAPAYEGLPICDDCGLVLCNCDLSDWANMDEEKYANEVVEHKWIDYWWKAEVSTLGPEEARKYERARKVLSKAANKCTRPVANLVHWALWYARNIHQGLPFDASFTKKQHAEEAVNAINFTCQLFDNDIIKWARWTKSVAPVLGTPTTRDFANAFLNAIKDSNLTPDQIIALSTSHFLLTGALFVSGAVTYTGTRRETTDVYVQPSQEFSELISLAEKPTRVEYIHKRFYWALKFRTHKYPFYDHFRATFNWAYDTEAITMETEPGTILIKSFLYLAIRVIGFIIVVKTLKAILGWLFGLFHVRESRYSSDIRKFAPRTKQRVPVVSQANSPSPNTHNLPEGVLLPFYAFTQPYENPQELVNYQPSAYVLAIDNEHILANIHSLERPFLYLATPREVGESYIIQLRDPKYVHLKGFADMPPDACVVRIPEQMWGVRSIRKRFIHKDDFMRDFAGYKMRARFLGSLAGFEDGNASLKSTAAHGIAGDIDVIDVLVQTDFDTRKGHCGIPYFGNNSIIGIHSGALDSRSKTFALTLQEDITDAIELLDQYVYPSYHVETERVLVRPEILEGWESNDKSFEMLGQCINEDGQEFKIHTPYDTALIPSLIADPETWPDKHAPSPKSPKLLVKNAQKYKIEWEFNHPLEEEVQFPLTYWSHILKKCPQRKQRIFSDDEVLNGNENVAPLMRDSSAGFWSLVSSCKNEFIDVSYAEDGTRVQTWSDGYYNTIHPYYGKTLHEVVCDTIAEAEQLRRGPKPQIWVTTLKDELLKEKKVLNQKTRVFESASIDETILIKKYFGAFGEFYRSHPGIVLGHAIGLDRVANWGAIYRMLRLKGDLGIDLDYAAFDSTIPPSFYVYFRRLVDLYYGDADPAANKVRATLIHGLQHSYQMINGKLTLSHLGNKSGMWLTDVLNSIANQWALMICFYRSFYEHHGYPPTIEEWIENVSLFTYGDDVIMTVTRRALQYFNGASIGGILTDLGFRATAGDKTELTADPRPLDELTFLKSAFVKADGFVSCPMPIETSFRELNWVRRKHANNYSVLVGMWNDALRFAAWHGKEEYDSVLVPLVDKLLALKLDHLTLELVDYKDVRSDFFFKQQALNHEILTTGQIPSVLQDFYSFTL